jgi:LemA protein
VVVEAILAFAAVAGLVAVVAMGYNRLIRLRNKVATAWAGIDVQLARRADLVPNLVETVRGARLHEREVLQAVTAARARLVEAQGPAATGRADDSLEGALGRLWAVAEAYPNLQTSRNFLQLQTELSRLEEDISFARRYYNGSADQFNTTQQRFPMLLIARPLGFREAEFFKAEPGARSAPGVELP